MTTDATAAPKGIGLTPEPIIQMLQGYQVTAILRTGLQLGVFDRLSDGPAAADEVAADIGADSRGVRILLEALAALQLLDVEDGTYRPGPLAETFLVRGHPTYFGGAAELLANEWEWEAYRRLDEAVRKGGTVLDEHAETPEHPWWEAFAPASSGLMQPAAAELAEILSSWALARSPVEVLDVACGGGLYSLAFIERHEHAVATLLDWPNVLAITRGTAKERGLVERTRFIEGDVFEVPLGGPYDLIIASHIFHHFSEERCLELLRRLADGLKPDGRLVIHEMTARGSEPAEEVFPRLFSVLMLVWTREGEAYPVSFYVRLLAEMGFGPPQVHDTQGPSRFLIAERAR